MWGDLSDERTGLSFTIAVGPRQRSHSRVRVPWNSRPYFTVSDSTLLISSLPTTRRTTVEVFDPASTRDESGLSLTLSLMLRPTVSWLVYLRIKQPSGTYEQIFILLLQLWISWFGAPSLTRGRVCRFTIAAGPRQRSYFRVRVP
jgi:hypothetical protein